MSRGVLVPPPPVWRPKEGDTVWVAETSTNAAFSVVVDVLFPEGQDCLGLQHPRPDARPPESFAYPWHIPRRVYPTEEAAVQVLLERQEARLKRAQQLFDHENQETLRLRLRHLKLVVSPAVPAPNAVPPASENE